MPTADATRAVIEAARPLAEAKLAEARALTKRRGFNKSWRYWAGERWTPLIDALAQYDRQQLEEPPHA